LRRLDDGLQRIVAKLFHQPQIRLAKADGQERRADFVGQAGELGIENIEMRAGTRVQLRKRRQDLRRGMTRNKIVAACAMPVQNVGRDKNLSARGMPRQGPQQPGNPIGNARMEGGIAARGSLRAVEDARGKPHLAVDEPRVMAMLSTAYGRPVAAHTMAKMRRAAELWNEGEKALAHIHLAHANLAPCGEDETLRLFLAEECFSEGITPAELMKAQGSIPALLALLKYNLDQPRVPAGSGRASGQWTSGGDGAGVAPLPATAGLASLPYAAAAGEGTGTLSADLFSEASPKFLAGLTELGAIIGGVGAVLGAIFVPSSNPGLTSEGAVPGDPNLRYAINHDKNTLRLTRDDEVVVAAQRGQDGTFYDETGTPIARDVGAAALFSMPRRSKAWPRQKRARGPRTAW
jgi:hypothetical protein